MRCDRKDSAGITQKIAGLRPDPPGDHRVLWSQVHGLGANVLVPRLEGAPRDDVNADSEEFLKILEQAHVIKERGIGLEVDEQIQAAARMSLSPGHGTEHRDPVGTALPRDAQDLCTAPAQLIKGQYVMAHHLRVSPHDLTQPDQQR